MKPILTLFLSAILVSVSGQITTPKLPTFTDGQCSTCQISFCPSSVQVPTSSQYTCDDYAQIYDASSADDQCKSQIQTWWCSAISQYCSPNAADLETKCRTAFTCLYSQSQVLSQDYVKQLIDSTCSQPSTSTSTSTSATATGANNQIPPTPTLSTTTGDNTLSATSESANNGGSSTSISSPTPIPTSTSTSTGTAKSTTPSTTTGVSGRTSSTGAAGTLGNLGNIISGLVNGIQGNSASAQTTTGAMMTIAVVAVVAQLL